MTEWHVSGRHSRFTLRSVREENYRTRTLIFAESLPSEPGQFAMAWIPDLDERPLSVAGDAPLKLTVANVGPFSAALHRLQPGDSLWIRGPLGRGFSLRGQRALLGGGGYGVAPLLFLAQRAVSNKIAVTACIGARTAADVLLVRDFESVGAAVHVITEDGTAGATGLLTDALEVAIAGERPDVLYACGPVRMLEAVDRLAQAHGLLRQLSWEAHMRCGIGLCGSCELPAPPASSTALSGLPHRGWLTCLDGPVSVAGEIT